MRVGRLTQLALLTLVLAVSALSAAEPPHQQVDRLVLAKAKQLAAPACDDAEFLRRAYLDLAGRIPSAKEAREFLQDRAPDRRAKLIDRLLAGPEYAGAVRDAFDVMLMERLGEHADWSAWLLASFEKNKPWDQMAREMLRGKPEGEAKGAPFFLSKRLENYGQNPVDYPALARDIGRLFLGIDLRCAQCHDHLFVKDYKQRDYQGLYAFVENVALAQGPTPAVQEKLTAKKSGFQSVFRKVPMETGPRVPGLKENEVPVLEKGKEYIRPPDPKTRTPGEPKFSTLAILAEQLPTADNPLFARNAVNRVWYLLMGRGLVHPLDLHHSGNPASHPEVLDLLAREFVAHKFDLKWLIRELMLTEVYQRSTVLPDGQKAPPPESFLVGLERRVSAEQLLASMLEAVGERPAPADRVKLRAKFLKAFADAPREPEDGFSPSLKAVLFLQHDETVLGWLAPREGNLVGRLKKLTDEQVADELYLSVLTRQPTAEEKAEVADYLKKNAVRRDAALGHLAWALLSSTEFCLNH